MKNKFSAIKGIQAGNEFYTIMVKLGDLDSLIPAVDISLSAEDRAQRQLNRKRIPAIKRYILDNRDSYVFSALACSIDGGFRFVPDSVHENVGMLEIDNNSKILINDGQHRKTAIIEALQEAPDLAEESISVVIFKDKGLKRSQQMFTDLNKHAVKTSNSIAELYDSKDEIAELTRHLLKMNWFIDKYTDREKDSLSKYSAKLFTFNTFYNANERILKDVTCDEATAERIVRYWNAVVNNISLWKQMDEGELPKVRLREDYLVCQAVVIEALGQVGAYFMVYSDMIEETLAKLSMVDWKRTAKCWSGRCVKENAKMMKSNQAIILTGNAIKKVLGIPLSEEEKNIEKKKR